MVVERIEYTAGSIQAKGALVWNDDVGGGIRPLMLVMTNWLGVTETAIERAEHLAGDEYIAFVGDMYGDGATCSGPPTSAEWMKAVREDRVEGRRRVTAALETLIAEADRRGIGDSTRTAAVGFCFGGGNVLELARAGVDVGAVVAVHADLATTLPAEPGAIRAPVFILHGSRDPISPKADRDAIEAELDAVDAHWQMLDFGGRVHAYTDEGAAVRGVSEFDAGATRQSFRMVQQFIRDAFDDVL